MHLDKILKNIFPRRAPIEKNEPIHETSLIVIAPGISGDSVSDCNNFKVGDSQPIAPPWHRVIIFAVKVL